LQATRLVPEDKRCVSEQYEFCISGFQVKNAGRLNTLLDGKIYSPQEFIEATISE
jgi:hypothetical protein